MTAYQKSQNIKWVDHHNYATAKTYKCLLCVRVWYIGYTYKIVKNKVTVVSGWGVSRGKAKKLAEKWFARISAGK